ncbi:conserved hypothetical protein [Candidatus Magnetomoraceae bacterium gMMP-13]
MNNIRWVSLAQPNLQKIQKKTIMDYWFLNQIIAPAFTWGAYLFIIFSIIILWRLKGILQWRRSLKSELKKLEKEAALEQGARHKALKVVQTNCWKLWQSNITELKDLNNLSDYFQSIAKCYYPEKEKPELCITTGQVLKSAREIIDRMDIIINRPGFKRLYRVRIRHIRQSAEWYKRASNYWIVKFFNRYSKIISKFSTLRLIILPDPSYWLFYLSRHLIMLILTKCLLVEIYLFTGKLGVRIYDKEDKEEEPLLYEAEELEKTLKALDSLETEEPDIYQPEILKIRKSLVGFNAVFFSNPGLKEWKNAVIRASDVIAIKHFPNAEKPVEEASIGPLMERTRMWLNTLCETENYPVVKRLHRIKIASLYDMKNMTENLLPKPVQRIAKKTWGVYKWMKWPLKIYRLVRMGSPFGVAIEVGGILAKKGFINFTCRYSFDMACKELDIIYQQSGQKC